MMPVEHLVTFTDIVIIILRCFSMLLLIVVIIAAFASFGDS